MMLELERVNVTKQHEVSHGLFNVTRSRQPISSKLQLGLRWPNIGLRICNCSNLITTPRWHHI